jgi:hypothetical protein
MTMNMPPVHAVDGLYRPIYRRLPVRHTRLAWFPGPSSVQESSPVTIRSRNDLGPAQGVIGPLDDEIVESQAEHALAGLGEVPRRGCPGTGDHDWGLFADDGRTHQPRVIPHPLPRNPGLAELITGPHP